MYHGFIAKKSNDIFDNPENLHLEIDKFETQVKFLSNNFNVISLSEFIIHMQSQNSFPENTVVLTIDDGYESNYKLAYPVLKKFKTKASIFLTTNFIEKKEILWTERLLFFIKALPLSNYKFRIENEEIDTKIESSQDKFLLYKNLKALFKKIDQIERENLIKKLLTQYSIQISFNDLPDQFTPLNWDQVNEMQQSGLVEFGSHTQSHFIIGRLPKDIAEQEMKVSKAIIEAKMDLVCDSFCYPNGQPGDFNEMSKKILINLGYSCALTTVQGFVNKSLDVYELPRLYVSNRDSWDQFLISLTGLRFS